MTEQALLSKPQALHVIITLVCVDPSCDCKFIWQLINTTANVAHIVFGQLHNSAKQPVENQETSVLLKKAFYVLWEHSLH